MIRFSCRCGHRFALADSAAGELLQCPRCGLLVDVPTLADMESLSDDGTVKLAEHHPPPARPGADLTEVRRAFTRDHVDVDGQEIDLRETAGTKPDDDFGPIPLSGEPPARDRTLPQYDPITGELVRDIALKEEPRPRALPVARPAPAIQYASGTLQRTITPAWLMMELFQPANFAVVFVVFLLYLLIEAWLAILRLMSGLIDINITCLAIPALIPLVAHFANTIQEVGPEGNDELPRPGRQLSFNDDIWGPFINVFIAVALSFPLPIAGACGVRLFSPTDSALGFVLFCAGLLVFPAVLLTTTTSGTLLNLRPDRVLAVIGKAGIEYILATVSGLLAIALSFAAVAGQTLLPVGVRIEHPKLAAAMSQPSVLFPEALVSIYFLHLFCWQLGLIYRTHQQDFPWVLQRHVPTARQGPPHFRPPPRPAEPIPTARVHPARPRR